MWMTKKSLMTKKQQKLLVASGKRLQNYGKPPFVIGKSAINGPCSIAMLLYQRVMQ
jgi:hypothetical protein